MKDVKFRAWFKQEKRMITNTQEFIPLIVTNKGVLRLRPDIKENTYQFMPNEWFEIMQCTGLMDQNDKEIYEGDVVIIQGGIFDEEYGYFVCEWDVDTARFILVASGLLVDFDNVYSYQLEVIGNIYENHELLEVEDEVN